MGKVRTRVLGNEEEEKKQKEEQKKRAQEKKATKEETADVTDQPEEKKTKKAKVAKSEPKTEGAKHGKKYVAARSGVEKGKLYAVTEAVSVLKKIKYANFDESVEVHMNVEKTGLKGEVDLPHTTGKTAKVAVVDDALLDKLDRNVIDFDILVTHPSYMPKLAKYAKLLGPKGLMPNPKAGTISPNPEELVKKFTAGAVRWKTEPKAPLVHQMVGKISHEEKQLAENIATFIKSVGKVNIMGAFVKTTMSPSLKIDLEKI